uniref:Uncharacterized protein n=1 Tax=Taeniopygia guttata TaxID=59729 RepID=A0A674HJ18_TAEGU
IELHQEQEQLQLCLQDLHLACIPLPCTNICHLERHKIAAKLKNGKGKKMQLLFRQLGKRIMLFFLKFH